ncbi:MAG: thioredoxin domain-containing protein, partial [Myxococcota bacterium]
FEHIAADLGWMKKPAGALLVLAIVAVVAGSSWHLRQYLNEARSNAPRPENMIINTAGSPSFGPANAPVTIIEISDFECPFCRKASVTLQGVVDAYTGKVRVVFKNFPLDQACNRMIKRPFHENACAAAAASMCASQNGYFWPFAKKLFNSALDRQAILDTAASFGFGQAEFETCMASGSAVDAVKLDIEDCIKAGVDSVPVFLVNGRKLVGAQTPATFRAVIDEELAASR